MKQEMPEKYKIDEILDSLDGMKPAEPRPFLHTRVMARLQKQQTKNRPSFFARPVWALGLLVLVLTVNILVISSKSPAREENRDGENLLAMEYGTSNWSSVADWNQNEEGDEQK
jgi:hypothetical protein